MDVTQDQEKVNQIIPFSLKDAPTLIEKLFPAQKISAEAQKERKAGAGQTLTALGSYWKGRKPLILNKACILGALLPATDDSETDLAIFEQLMAIDDEALKRRAKSTKHAAIINDLPYLERLNLAYRPEEISDDELYGPVWKDVNVHLGTNAYNFPELVAQLGIMRFGHVPQIGDTFCGGGSIPFEAARLGCNVYASDLNPVACMLTWGTLNIVGASSDTQKKIEKAQREVAEAVDREIADLDIEYDDEGNRAKAFIYCLETICPNTGWYVPILPTLVISKGYHVRANLIPNHSKKAFDIEILSNASEQEMKIAEIGTYQDGQLVYTIDGIEYRTPLKTIRGDYKLPDGVSGNRLRRWEKEDFMPRHEDIFQERLYCIQWITKETLKKSRQKAFFASVRGEDLERERKVEQIIRKNLTQWQAEGFVPDMLIEPGYETSRLIRERGWTYWHHLFLPRQILMLALILQKAKAFPDTEAASIYLRFGNAANYLSKLTPWATSAARVTGGPSDNFANTFYNQALNTQYMFGTRAWEGFRSIYNTPFKKKPLQAVSITETLDAKQLKEDCDIFITDPPYADAVYYHEITEFFISWLRKNLSNHYKNWIWDSRRVLAIKGSGEDFRRDMIAAYQAMAEHMPDNGLQIVMFTHQDAGVWADMASIMWGAGLQVAAAWYIATETTSELKKGGYVQGTVLLVLRKRLNEEYAYRDELVQEVKAEVELQIDTLVGLNQTTRGSGRTENLFEDADLQMAGYAAALRVLTGYTKIDGQDMTAEALRPRPKGEKGLVGEIIDFAVQVANEHLVPEGITPAIWEDLTGSERFYLKMLELEAIGLMKLDNYQNFAKAFRVGNYTALMSSTKANAARLKTSGEFKKTEFEGEFGSSGLRAVLYALYELQKDVDGDTVMGHLRDLVAGYHHHREELKVLVRYIAAKREKMFPQEAEAARILFGCIQNERLGG